MGGTLNFTMSTTCLSQGHGLFKKYFSDSMLSISQLHQRIVDPSLGHVITSLDSDEVCSFTWFWIKKLTDCYITTTDWLLIKFKNTIPIFVCILIVTGVAAIISGTLVSFLMKDFCQSAITKRQISKPFFYIGNDQKILELSSWTTLSQEYLDTSLRTFHNLVQLVELAWPMLFSVHL